VNGRCSDRPVVRAAVAFVDLGYAVTPYLLAGSGVQANEKVALFVGKPCDCDVSDDGDA